MGRWTLSIEGATTYSPDPPRKAARARMERAVYRQRGVLIATDYLVNSGGVIFAAQEQLIPTPAPLHMPDAMRGDRTAVQRWLAEHAEAFAALAEQRRQAAETYRAAVIQRNMRRQRIASGFSAGGRRRGRYRLLPGVLILLLLGGAAYSMWRFLSHR